MRFVDTFLLGIIAICSIGVGKLLKFCAVMLIAISLLGMAVSEAGDDWGDRTPGQDIVDLPFVCFKCDETWQGKGHCCDYSTGESVPPLESGGVDGTAKTYYCDTTKTNPQCGACPPPLTCPWILTAQAGGFWQPYLAEYPGKNVLCFDKPSAAEQVFSKWRIASGLPSYLIIPCEDIGGREGYTARFQYPESGQFVMSMAAAPIGQILTSVGSKQSMTELAGILNHEAMPYVFKSFQPWLDTGSGACN